MNFHFRPHAALLLLLAVLCLSCPPGRAASKTADLSPTLKCEIELGLGDIITSGTLLPVRLAFRNSGPARTIRVHMEAGMNAVDVYSIPAKGYCERWIYLPVIGRMSLRVTDVRFYDADSGERLLKTDMFGSALKLSSDTGAEAVGLSVGANARDLLQPTGGDDSKLKMSHARSSELPPQWAGLSGYDLLIVDSSAWFSPEFPRQAAIDWMSMGGVCVLVGADEASRRRFRRQLEERGVMSAEESKKQIRVGMGEATFRAANEGGWLSAVESLFSSSAPHAPARSGQHRALLKNVHSLDIPGIGQVPFWPILGFLAVFALAVGPGGWWYVVYRKGRPLLYYGLAPALSLVVTGLVVAADLAAHGLTAKVCCRAVRFIDQGSRRSAFLSQFGAYAPVALGSSPSGYAGEVPVFFPLKPEKGVTHVKWDRIYGASDELRGVTVDYTGSRPVYHGALPARQERWFGTLQVGSYRPRLLVSKRDGALRVENHLEKDLEELWVAHEGQYAKVEGLQAGASATVQPGARDEVDMDQVWDREIDGWLPQKATSLVREWRGEWKQGSGYAARVGGVTEEDMWLDEFEARDSESFIFGTFE